MKYLLLILLFACGQRQQPHELQVIASYKDDKMGYGIWLSDGLSGRVSYLHHDKKHNRFDTIIIEVRRQKDRDTAATLILGNPVAGEAKPISNH